MGEWRGPPGSQGAPKGSRNGAKGTRWKNQLEKALKQYEIVSDDPKVEIRRGRALRKIAEEMICAATDRSDPNFQFAVKEIGLRLDGKPKEHIEVSDGTNAAFAALGISAAFAQLVQASTGGEIIDGEVIVPDRSLLSSEICAEAGGHGEGLDIPKVSGGTG